MAVQPFNKFNSFVEAVAEKAHNLGSDNLKVMLTNTLPTAANTKYSDISATELANGAGYTTGGATPTISSSAQTGGVYKLVLADAAWTASASMGPFRYAVLYNNTDATTPKGLIGWWDNGSSVTLLNTETFTVDFDATAGVLTLT